MAYCYLCARWHGQSEVGLGGRGGVPCPQCPCPTSVPSSGFRVLTTVWTSLAARWQGDLRSRHPPSPISLCLRLTFLLYFLPSGSSSPRYTQTGSLRQCLLRLAEPARHPAVLCIPPPLPRKSFGPSPMSSIPQSHSALSTRAGEWTMSFVSCPLLSGLSLLLSSSEPVPHLLDVSAL